jgi:hypothetical protein
MIDETRLIEWIQILLPAAAVGQVLVACLNLGLVSLLGWKEHLAAMPLLLRQVFRVHQWFITITLLLFAVWTWKLAPQIAPRSELAGWVCAGISLFWGIRTVMQVTYYSSSHWRGKPARILVHIILLIAYGACALTYGIAAWFCLPERF